MQPHSIVSREEWISARKAHLAHEKEYTARRDRLSEERRARPGSGSTSLTCSMTERQADVGDLYAGRNQLVVQHFMFRPTGTKAARAARSGRTVSSA